MALAAAMLAAVAISLQAVSAGDAASPQERARATAPLPSPGAIPPAVRKTESGPLASGPFHPVLAKRVDYGDKVARFGGARNHPGQDVFAPHGTPLVAVRDGTVVDRGKAHSAVDGGRGNFVALYVPKLKVTYVYLHLDKPSPVHKGQRVRAGHRVGNLGCTGYCDGYHLHFEIRRGKESFGPPINPLKQLRSWKPAPRP